MFSWLPGRQNDSGYRKLKLFGIAWPIEADIHLIEFPVGSFVDHHVDPVKEGHHYRFQVILRHAGIGGKFFCWGPHWQGGRFAFFRSDRYEHEVTRVFAGKLLILSIGWVWG